MIVSSTEPATLQLIRAHQRHAGSVVAIREVEQQDIERHGIVRIEPSAAIPSSKSVRVTGLVEKPSAAAAPSRLGVFGRYLLESAVWDAIARTKPDACGEVQLTDALNLLCQTNLLYGLCFEGHHYDAGHPLGYLKANIELSLRDPHTRPALLEYLARLQA
jgi:UTP--glucose-1-phosphate uridylyltransferase